MKGQTVGSSVCEGTDSWQQCVWRDRQLAAVCVERQTVGSSVCVEGHSWCVVLSHGLPQALKERFACY